MLLNRKKTNFSGNVSNRSTISFRSSIRSSKKLKALAKETKEASENVENTSSYDNECYEQPKEASVESIRELGT